MQTGLSGFDGGNKQRPADGVSDPGVAVGLAEGPGLGAPPSTSDGSDGVEGVCESFSIGGGSSESQEQMDVLIPRGVPHWNDPQPVLNHLND